MQINWIDFLLLGYCKWADELGEARSTISEITRRYHELEIELRRLENERDELTAAYKEAEAVSSYWKGWNRTNLNISSRSLQGRKAEEQRAQRLASEYNQFRHEAERRLAEKDEEIESIR